jgi:dihydroorotase
MYDLLIKGGRVIDPAQDTDDITDVAVNGNRIAALSRNIPRKEAVKVKLRQRQ